MVPNLHLIAFFHFFVSYTAFEKVEVQGKGSFNVTCRDGWTLLSCGSENLPSTSFDPSRSVWPSNSSCRCHDAYGMKCSAWCTKWKIPTVNQTIIKLRKDCSDSFCTLMQGCLSADSTLIGCYFKGNANGSIERKQSYFYSTLLSTCMLQGLKDDEFVLTCMPASYSVKINVVGSYNVEANSTQLLGCSSEQGKVMNCQPGDRSKLNDYAIIRNETACECYGEDTFHSCAILCMEMKIPY